MLSADEAKKIGIDACIEKLGFEFCKKHADNATSAYGEDDGIMNCFVGVDDSPAPNSDIKDVDELILDVIHNQIEESNIDVYDWLEVNWEDNYD